MRAALVAVGTVGWLGLTVLEAALVPLVFALLTVFAKDETKKSLRGYEESLRGALRGGRTSFRDMQRRALYGRRGRAALPPGPEPPRLPPRRR